MALDLPGRGRAELAAWRDELIAGRDDLRPVAEGALHVTLAFLGYRAEEEIEAVAAVLAKSVEMSGPGQPLLLPRAIVGVPPRRPRLFALDLADDGGRGEELQRAVSGGLESAGFYTPEKRPFWPHVTLARVKRDRRADPLPAEPPPLPGLRGPRVTLYRSVLRPQGALYEPLAEAALNGA